MPARRVANIVRTLTWTCFCYVHRGLYEKDRAAFALLLALKILACEDLAAGALASRQRASRRRASGGAAGGADDQVEGEGGRGVRTSG